MAVVERVARGTVSTPTPSTSLAAVAGPAARASRGAAAERSIATSRYAAAGRRSRPRSSRTRGGAWRRLRTAGPVAVTPSPERGYRSRARLHAARGASRVLPRGHAPVVRRGRDRAAVGRHRGLDPRRRGSASRAGGAEGSGRSDVVENAAGTERACHLLVHGSGGRATTGGAGVRSDRAVCRRRRRARHDDGAGGGIRRAGRRGAAGRPVGDGRHRRQRGRARRVDVSLRHDVRSFFQGNRFLLEPLVQHRDRSRARRAGPRSLRGNRTLRPRAGRRRGGPDRAGRGRPVERPRPGGQRAPCADWRGSEQRRAWKPSLAAPRPGMPTWIVDPPRTGLSGRRPRGGAAAIGRTASSTCRATWPRWRATSATWPSGGYEVTALTGVDMFPSTAHVEAVCVLDAAATRR